MTELDTRVVIDSATGGINEVQSVKVDGTGGTFTLELEGEKTDTIAWNASAATVEAELVELASVDSGDVSVTGGPGNSGGTTPYLVTFEGDLGGQNVELLADADELTGGGADVTVSVVTAGESPEEANAIIRGTGDADRTGEASLLSGDSPAEDRAANKADYGDA
jgi:hypothetical protein